MGTEYACVDDATGEAYDLGRGPWYEWAEDRVHLYDERRGPPTSREDVRALLEWWMQNWALGPQPAWACAVEDSIWTFIVNHPGMRVVHDLGECEWYPESWDEFAVAIQDADARVYRQIGTRYDHEGLIVGKDDERPGLRHSADGLIESVGPIERLHDPCVCGHPRHDHSVHGCLSCDCVCARFLLAAHSS